MKAICLRAKSGPEGLKLEEIPMPLCAAGEVLVKIYAAGVTPTELTWYPTWNTRSGESRAFPIVPGHEFSGVVHAIGGDVNDLNVGDAIYGMNDWFGNGAQAEFCVARSSDVTLKPHTIDHVLAAMTPISALTAWQGLIERAKLAAGERVLIHAGAGSVGIFAVQLARWRGAQVISTASAHNLEFVKSLGADVVIDHRAQRFEEIAKHVDVIFDTVGGETLDRSWSLLRPGGRVITIASAGESTQDQRAKDAFFIVEPNRSQLTKISEMIDANTLRPIVDKIFPLADARLAYETKPVRGKVVLKIRSSD